MAGNRHHSCSSMEDPGEQECFDPPVLLQTPALPKVSPRVAKSDAHFNTSCVEQESPLCWHREQVGFFKSQRTWLARHCLQPPWVRVLTGPTRSAAFLRGIPSDWTFTWPDFDRACRRRLRMCRISYQISKTEVAVDQPANENTRHPAEIYTRNTGHAVVDNLI